MSIDALGTDLWTDSDTEEFRIRALQAAANASFVPAEMPLKKSQSAPALSGISSLSRSKTERIVPQFKPQLSEPILQSATRPATEHFMIGLLRTQQETERLTAKNTRLFEVEVKADQANIEKLSTEKQEALKRAAQETETRSTWDVLSNVAQYIASASAVVLGIACVATGVGTAAGALLIASGGLGLLNRVMHDTHGWEAVVSWFTASKELQTKIASKIEMGMFLLSLGLGLAGGAWAYSAGAFTAVAEGGRQTFMAKAGQVIALGGAFMGAGSKLGSSVVERRIAHLHARIREIETQITTKHQTVYQTSSDTEKMIETNQSVTDEVAKAISTSQISFE